MASTSPYVKTRGEKRQAKQPKQKAGGNDVLPANDADRPTGDNTGGSIMSMAELAGKLDIIMVRLDKLDVIDQMAAQVASLSTSLEFCHASFARKRMWDMWTCGTALWGMKNCTLEMAYILVERGLPFLPRDCQGRLPVALVKYDI